MFPFKTNRGGVVIICGILTGLKYYILEYPFDFNLPLAEAQVLGTVLGDWWFAVVFLCIIATERKMIKSGSISGLKCLQHQLVSLISYYHWL